MNRRFLSLLPAAAALLALTAATPSPAGLTWDTTSLRRVYQPGPGQFYAYAPSALQTPSGLQLWACHNADSGVIRDHIFQVPPAPAGTAPSGHSVLAAGPDGTWDSFHTCDPSVVAASGNFKGLKYAWLMAYLGNDVNASAHNQIGLAVAASPNGPWTKLGAPVVTAPDDGTWGVGQPSLIALDATHFMLFYTSGQAFRTGGFWRSLDLTNPTRPKTGPDVPLTDAGLTGSDGNLDYLNNFDVAYAPASDRYYIVREQHPYPKDRPTYIGASLQVNSLSAADLRAGRGVWRVEGNITPALTRFPRNHNAGLIRDPMGRLPDPKTLGVILSRSCAQTASDPCPVPEWTYELWRIDGKLR